MSTLTDRGLPQKTGPTSTGPIRSLRPGLVGRSSRRRTAAAGAPDDEDEDEDEDEDARWGRDAAAFPPDYWHWIHLRNLNRLEHRLPASGGDGPARAPLLSLVVPVYRPALWYFRECVRSVLAPDVPELGAVPV